MTLLRCATFVLLFCVWQNTNLNAQPTFAISPASGTYSPNEEVCLDFFTEDFRNLVGFAFPVNWEANNLIFKEIRNINLPSLERSNFDLSNADNGTLRVVWEEEDFFPLTVNDGFVMFKACFQTPADCGASATVQINTQDLSSGETTYANTAFSLNDEIVGINVGFSEESASVVVPCDCDLTASIQATSIAVSEAGYIDLCPGDMLGVLGAVDFPPDATPTNDVEYIWNFGDGTRAEGVETSHAYTEGGIYTLSFRVEDSPASCASNIVRLKVRVAPAPSVTLVNEEQTYCPNELIELNSQNVTLEVGIATEQTSDDITTVIPEGFLADTLAIPDGQGAVYESTLDINFFEADEFIVDGSEIVKVCANMEHSWARDLRISLLCPNGESVILHDFLGQSGNRIRLGEPVDNDDGNPLQGIGYTYCWTMNTDNATLIEEGTGSGAFDLPAGDYKPAESFDGFIACPLNGTWTLQVEDLWPRDNGYIFNWGILFEQSLLPDGETYSPRLTGFTWLDNPATQNIEGETTTLLPTQTGTLAVPYAVTNEVGCTFEGALELSIESGEACGCETLPRLILPASPRCAPNNRTYSVRVNTEPGNLLIPSNGLVAGSSGFLTVYNIPNGEDITVRVINDEGCEASAVIEAPNCGTNIDCNGADSAMASISGDLEICQGESTTLTASGGSSFAWNNNRTTSSIDISTAGTYTVTVTNVAGCTDVASATITEIDCGDSGCDGVAQITGQSEVCIGERTVLTASGGVSYAWDNFARSNKVGVRAGTYTVTVTDANGCTDVTSFTVTEIDCTQDCPMRSAPQSTGDKTACASARIFPPLTVTNAGVNPASEIRWYDMPEGGTSLATGSSFIPPTGGTYYAEIYDLSNDCTSPRRAITLTLLGCGSESPAPVHNFGKIVVQPNPFVAMTSIRFDVQEANWIDVQVYDLAGKILLQENRFYEAGQQNVDLAAEQLGQSGIYFFRIQSAEQTYLGKLILQE